MMISRDLIAGFARKHLFTIKSSIYQNLRRLCLSVLSKIIPQFPCFEASYCFLFTEKIHFDLLGSYICNQNAYLRQNAISFYLQLQKNPCIQEVKNCMNSVIGNYTLLLDNVISDSTV